MTKPERLEQFLAFMVVLVLVVFLFVNYDKWTPSGEFPSSWRSGLFETILKFTHYNTVGRILGKGTLILLGAYSLRKVMLALWPNKK